MESGKNTKLECIELTDAQLKWMQEKERDALLTPVRKFPRRCTMVSGTGVQLQADLNISILAKNGVKFLLTLVDSF